MKIAMVSPKVVPATSQLGGHIGGAETYVFSLSLEMSKIGHQVTLITGSEKGPSQLQVNNNLTVKYLSNERLFTWNGEDPYSHKVASVLIHGTFDLVHIHQIFTGFNVASCLTGKLAGIPTFGTDHGGGPVFYRVFPQICVGLPDFLVTVSENSLQYLNKIVPNKNSYIAYGGVDIEVFNPDYRVDHLKRQFGLDGYRVVLCVGRLLSCKGFDVAIKALQYMPKNTKMLIVGPSWDIRYYNYLRELAQPFGDRVIFTGHISAQDLPRYYNLCDVFVRSSVNIDCFGRCYNFPELLGLVKFEAMACGKPVVVSDTGGLPEQVIDGQHGYIVKAGDDMQLGNALNAILCNDKLCRQMGRDSMNFVRSNFSWRKVAERVSAFYAASV